MSKQPERIQRSEYQRFFELSNDLLCIAGLDGYFKALNPAWQRVLGWSIDELLAEPYVDFVHPEDRRSTLEAASRLRHGEEVIAFDNRYLARDGSYRWLHWNAVPILDRGRIYAMARDMTRRKEAEAALAAAKEAAEAATEAKSAFLATMSHELRTPLNSVIGFSNLLLAQDGPPGESERLYLERIKANGESLLLLINELLDLEKVEAGKMEIDYEEVDLGLLVSEVAGRFEAELHGRPVRLEIEVPADLPLFKTDYQKLTQILTNLIGNAVKFTDEGAVKVRVLAPSGSPVPAGIEVEDSGIGIPADKLERIFERFEQIEAGTSRRYPGTGLGLAISRALCQLMGYELEVESAVGVGTTFTLRFGAAVAADATVVDRDSQTIALKLVREIEAEARRAAFTQRSILVIDDQKDSRELLSRLFRDLGCQVMTASTAPQGLRLARERSPDLITLDLVMPATDGWQLLDLLDRDAHLRSIPVVVISTLPDDRRALARGVAGFLRKPVTALQLERVLYRQLAPPLGRILVVEADPLYRERIGSCLEACAEELRCAASGEAALGELAHFTPDLAVVALEMTQMGGRELIARIREQPPLARLPIILTSEQRLKPSELHRIGREVAPLLRKGPQLEENLRELCWAIRARHSSTATVAATVGGS